MSRILTNYKLITYLRTSLTFPCGLFVQWFFTTNFCGTHALDLSVFLVTQYYSSSSFITSVFLPQGLSACPVHFASEPDDPFILWQDIKKCLHKLCCVIDSVKKKILSTLVDISWQEKGDVVQPVYAMEYLTRLLDYGRR